MRLHDDDCNAALLLLKKLRDALCEADSTASKLHETLIQNTTEFLEKHGADDPSFQD
jgi:hypothetical protein